MGYLEAFLDLYPRPNTQSTYRHALKKFFHAMYPDSDENEYQLADRYMQDHRYYKRDIQIFQQSIHSRPPKTIWTYIAAIKAFLVENDIEFSNKFWRRISRRINETRARTRDKVPSTAELRNLMMHLPIAGKSYFGYCGTYEVHGSTIMHTVEVNFFPNNVGTQVIRYFTLDGDRLTLSTPPRQVEGRTHIGQLVWQKTK